VARTEHVFRWDLDKTYLRTEFDTVRDLVKTAFETASDKQAVPGAPALLRALRGDGENHRICIISGSPKQMRRVLDAKLKLDGVEYDEFVLKDNLSNLLRGRFRAMRSQVPYKLPALLESRASLDDQPAETLFGDDAEADAVVYSLYADLVSGAVELDELPRILAAARAYPDQIERAMQLCRRIERANSVDRILIHLDRRSPTARFSRFGRRLVPIYNYFQAASVLHRDGLLTAAQVLFVVEEMLADPSHTPSTLANSLQDLVMRGRVSQADARTFTDELREIAETTAATSEPGTASALATTLDARLNDLGDAPPLEWPDEAPRLDYVALVDADHDRRRSEKRSAW